MEISFKSKSLTSLSDAKKQDVPNWQLILFSYHQRLVLSYCEPQIANIFRQLLLLQSAGKISTVSQYLLSTAKRYVQNLFQNLQQNKHNKIKRKGLRIKGDGKVIKVFVARIRD